MNSTTGLDLRRGLALLRAHWLLVLILTAAGGGAGYAGATHTAESHVATTRLLVNIPDARETGEALQGVQLSSKLLRSYASLITTQPALARIRQESGLEVSAGELRSRLSARPEPSTLILDIIATSPTAEQAVQLSTAAADVLTETIAEVESSRSAPVTARVVDPALASPVSRIRTVIAATGAAALLGFFLGLLLALARQAMDKSISTPEQAEAATGTPILGIVPSQSRKITQPAVTHAPQSVAAEAFRELRTALMLGGGSGQQPRSVLVTSPVAGDGKSQVALNLAASLSASGLRTVLVDADLRRGRLAEALGLNAEIGVTSYACNRDSAARLLQQVDERLSLLARGPVPSNPAEILGSQAMADLLWELSEVSDVIVIDAPPVIPVTDAVVLAADVHATVLVARHGHTPRGLTAEAARRLLRVGANVRGCVLNDVESKTMESYYADYRPLALPSAASPLRVDFGAGRPAVAHARVIDTV